MAIKNIIFDLGGVLLDIDYNKTTRAFLELGYPDFEKMYSQFTADELFQKLETGKISSEAFCKVLSEAHAKDINPGTIRAAWNSMLLDWRPASLDFLNVLSGKYKLFLLSNTNAIHMEAFTQTLKEQTGRESIDGLFTKAYYSHQIHLRKPNRDIFDFVAKDAGILPQETMLVDDSENNIETAAGLGFQSHLLLPNERIEDLNYETV